MYRFHIIVYGVTGIGRYRHHRHRTVINDSSSLPVLRSHCGFGEGAKRFEKHESSVGEEVGAEKTSVSSHGHLHPPTSGLSPPSINFGFVTTKFVTYILEIYGVAIVCGGVVDGLQFRVRVSVGFR